MTKRTGRTTLNLQASLQEVADLREVIADLVIVLDIPLENLGRLKSGVEGLARGKSLKDLLTLGEGLVDGLLLFNENTVSIYSRKDDRCGERTSASSSTFWLA